MRNREIPLIALAFMLLATIPCSPLPAQEKKISKKDVPAAVMAAFTKSYPHAKIKGTSTEVEKGTTYFEIESMDGIQARDVLYMADGTASEIEETLAPAALPAPVKEAVAKEFAKAKITKAEKVTKGSDIAYEIHVSLGAKKGSIVVDPAGKTLEKKNLSARKAKSGKEEDEEDEEEDD